MVFNGFYPCFILFPRRNHHFCPPPSISSVPRDPREAHHVYGMAVQVRHGAVVQLLGGVLLGAKAAQVVADHLQMVPQFVISFNCGAKNGANRSDNYGANR